MTVEVLGLSSAAGAFRAVLLVTALSFLAACGSEGESAANGAGGQTGGRADGTRAGTGGQAIGTGGSVDASTGGSLSAGAGGSLSASAGTGGSTSTSGAGGGSSSGGATMGAGGSGGFSNPGDGGTADPGGAGGLDGAAGGAGGSPLPPVTNFADPGPFKTTTQVNTGPDGTYTIIRPQTLGEAGFLHAPITFGPGTGMQVSQLSGLLERLASHGFVVIGRQLMGGPGDPVTRMRMTAGLDWIIAQNSVAGSVFEGKLDVKRAVAMGYSVGGTGAVEIGGHEAISTVVSIHGHGAEGDLHGPLLLIGGTADVMNDGMSWLAPTYEASQVQTFFGTVVGADHGYIQGTVDGVPGGVETPAIVAWLRHWIYDDQGAKNYFYGDDCVMCESPWTEPKRKNWQ